MKDVTLALGGGGVKGNAHVGVLRALAREGYTVQAIAGTSAGALWGSLYAAGLSADQIEEYISPIQASNLYYRTPETDGPSFLGLAGVEQALRTALGDCVFSDLPLPFAVTAVDINTAEELILNRGRVIDAVMASIAVPGIFPPRKWEGRTLIDGGILDPVPVRLARLLAPGLPVVAVVLSPPMDEWEKPHRPRLLANLPFVSTYLSRLRVARALDIFIRSVDIAGAKLSELRLMIDQPEVIVRPEVSSVGLLDEVDVHDLIKRGEKAVEAALPDLRSAVGWRSWLSRRIQPPSRPARYNR